MSRFFWNSLLVFASSCIALVVFIGSYEAVQSVKYERWRAKYDKDKELHGGLTVASEDLDILWEYQPNAKREIEGSHYSIETNAFGMRNPAITLQPRADRLRIAFIGDSVTLGLGVEEHDGFVRQIEQLARRRGYKIECLNFGIDGFHALQIEALLKDRVLKFGPDLVVYTLCLNDFDFDNASGNKIKYFKKPASFFLRKLRRLIRERAMRSMDYHEYYYQLNRESVVASIRRMKAYLASHRIPFSVVIVPAFYSEQPDFDQYHLVPLHLSIRDDLIGLGIDPIDTLFAFRASNRGPHEYAIDIWHPNADGHRLIAATILDVLSSTELPAVSAVSF